jgi:hypothetical protein
MQKSNTSWYFPKLIAKSDYSPICPLAWNNSTPSGHIFVKLYNGDF